MKVEAVLEWNCELKEKLQRSRSLNWDHNLVIPCVMTDSSFLSCNTEDAGRYSPWNFTQQRAVWNRLNKIAYRASELNTVRECFLDLFPAAVGVGTTCTDDRSNTVSYTSYQQLVKILHITLLQCIRTIMFLSSRWDISFVKLHPIWGHLCKGSIYDKSWPSLPASYSYATLTKKKTLTNMLWDAFNQKSGVAVDSTQRCLRTSTTHIMQGFTSCIDRVNCRPAQPSRVYEIN